MNALRSVHRSAQAVKRGFGGIDKGFPKGLISFTSVNAVLLAQVFDPNHNGVRHSLLPIFSDRIYMILIISHPLVPPKWGFARDTEGAEEGVFPLPLRGRQRERTQPLRGESQIYRYLGPVRISHDDQA